jgi:hypothetical protein
METVSPKEKAKYLLFNHISESKYNRIIDNGSHKDYEYLGQCQESAFAICDMLLRNLQNARIFYTQTEYYQKKSFYESVKEEIEKL